MSRASELLNADYATLRRALDAGEVSSVDLTRESVRRARASQPELNAYISFREEAALAEAQAADARLKADEKGGVLGMPIAVKDLILTKDHETTAASKMLKGFIPPYDATVTARLRKAGAPIIGKANLDEYAMGSSNETSFFGPCRNPWDPTRVPGGSSGGSAAAVASRTATLSLGTDTGGSIRQPAALTGITGVKPTYGRVSRYGVVAFASSLDQVGPMCSDALSCAAVLEAISGYDAHDATSSRKAVPAFVRETEEFAKQSKLKGLRVGLPKEFFGEGLDPTVEKVVREAIERLKGAGAVPVEISLPHTKYSLPVYYIVCTSEASSNLARYDGIHYGHRAQITSGATLEELYAASRGEGFGDEVRLRILTGTYALSSGYYDAYYRKASQVRALIRRDFEQAFKQCDVIAGPTSPTPAFKIGEKFGNPLAMYLADVFTLSTNLAGIPGLSLNAGFDATGLPVGLQLLAPWWEESRILGVAHAYQTLHADTLRLSPMARNLSASAAQGAQ
jgi:aspartyl-tRNA(Asn)/glutamyl-tRNA(Gln) amidotransferase subunit A